MVNNEYSSEDEELVPSQKEAKVEEKESRIKGSIINRNTEAHANQQDLTSSDELNSNRLLKKDKWKPKDEKHKEEPLEPNEIPPKQSPSHHQGKSTSPSPQSSKTHRKSPNLIKQPSK